jgi:DNA-binding MarR family transcriptional regulator
VIDLCKNNVTLEFSELIGTMHLLGLKMRKSTSSEVTEQKLRTLFTLKMMGRSKLKDISSVLFVSTSSLCTMFNHLEKEGFIVREIDSTDRRNTYYSITPMGELLCNKEIRAKEQLLTEFLSVLDSNDIEKLTLSLTQINSIIKKIV